MAERKNKLVDGWKGIVIIFVVIGHLTQYRYHEVFQPTRFLSLFASTPLSLSDIAWNILLRILIPLPNLGMSIFLIISGYLLTSILMREENSFGSINMTAFYVRRCFKILPSLCALLLVTFVLKSYGLIEVPNEAFFWTAAFLCNIPGTDCSWWLGHTWTLGVQEQFYIVLPFWFLFLARSARVMLLIASLSFLLVLSIFVPFGIHFGCISAGSLYALSPAFRSFIGYFETRNGIAFALALLFSRPFIASFSPIIVTVISAMTPILLCIIFFGTLNGKGFIVNVAANGVVGRIGIASYSIYVWQEMFTARPEMYITESLLRFPILLVPCFLLAYFVIERPLFRVGRRISHRLIEQGERRSNLSDLSPAKSSKMG